MSHIVSDEQAAYFREHGYVAVPGFFNAREVAAMQAEVARFKEQGLVSNVATDEDGETTSTTKQNLQLLPIHKHSDLFRALPFEPSVIEAVKSMIGEPYRLHLDQMFLKPAKNGSGTSWHQDNGYFHIENPLMGTAMWIAVHDATRENGTISVIPDSFAETLEHTRDSGSNHHVRCYPPEDQAVHLELEAGGVAFFCYGTPHATWANTTDKDRAGVAYHFLREDFIPEDYSDRLKESMACLTGDDASDGTKEYGAPVRATLADEVEKVLAGAS
jgi:phytanoyl-CoA hydroxylase